VYFLHDGRTSDLLQAIQLHASGAGSRSNDVSSDATANHGGDHGGWNQTVPSEANRVIANFNNLNAASQQDLLNFLRSL
jgi:CxxC motif-containing protein (DUF1111 family)